MMANPSADESSGPAPNEPLYDHIGTGYGEVRKPDPRIHGQVIAALGTARQVVNVGAGTGNYEPTDRAVVAVEPSEVMVRQRPKGSAPVVRAVAESLPFADGYFDAALATFSVHHWSNQRKGLHEIARVSKRQVILMTDLSLVSDRWFYEYFPGMLDIPSEQRAPTLTFLADCLRVIRVEVVPIPADCTDRFCGAFWNRPESLLDPAVRAGSSSLAQLDPAAAIAGTHQLAEDLQSGRWDAHHGRLRQLDELDMGYRIVIAGE